MKFETLLTNIQALYVDTAPFIYFVEQNPLYVDQMREIFTYTDQGVVHILTSVITLTETLTIPFKLRDTVLENTYRELFEDTENITLVPVNQAIAEQAAKLRAIYNLKTPDALQIATAIETGCDAFLTNDKGLKRIVELSVLILEEFKNSD